MTFCPSGSYSIYYLCCISFNSLQFIPINGSYQSELHWFLIMEWCHFHWCSCRNCMEKLWIEMFLFPVNKKCIHVCIHLAESFVCSNSTWFLCNIYPLNGIRTILGMYYSYICLYCNWGFIIQLFCIYSSKISRTSCASFP